VPGGKLSDMLPLEGLTFTPLYFPLIFPNSNGFDSGSANADSATGAK
jgi:hypothetical protein